MLLLKGPVSSAQLGSVNEDSRGSASMFLGRARILQTNVLQLSCLVPDLVFKLLAARLISEIYSLMEET